ncbi:hypothetical protein F6X40_34590 [Paraburkholderia sp. UCT31]|uniref:hypothetical protein n=1 Tax=Paraburkholderia sp. UCT31 TaxID=2615209 RepID=UPI0016562760|nr:hypothetical protein [Paraburkholderia sp. UCT31]MBC8741692.1 hypothetical protein [Paraburkholderia sp. UCT31]
MDDSKCAYCARIGGDVCENPPVDICEKAISWEADHRAAQSVKAAQIAALEGNPLFEVLKRAVGLLSLHGYEADAKSIAAEARALSSGPDARVRMTRDEVAESNKVLDEAYADFCRSVDATSTAQDAGNAWPTRLQMLAYELDGVIIDTENSGFDDVCLRTVKRVRDALEVASAGEARMPLAEAEPVERTCDSCPYQAVLEGCCKVGGAPEAVGTAPIPPTSTAPGLDDVADQIRSLAHDGLSRITLVGAGDCFRGILATLAASEQERS